jgi:hypothetical protein
MPIKSIPNGFTYDQVSVPSSPSAGETWRERNSSRDIIQDWYYNGSRWLGTSINTIFSPFNSSIAVTSGFLVPAILHRSYNIWLESFQASYYVAGANDASNFWSIYLLVLYASSGNPTTVGTIYNSAGTNISALITTTSAGASNTGYGTSNIIGSNLISSQGLNRFQVNSDKTLSPGNVSFTAAINYRLAR